MRLPQKEDVIRAYAGVPAGRRTRTSLTGTLLPRGSALANTISQYTLALLLFFYIRGRKLHQATWGGKDRRLSSKSDAGLVLG